MKVLLTTAGYTGREESPEWEGYDKVYVTSVNRIHSLLRSYRVTHDVEVDIVVTPDALLKSFRETLLFYTFDPSRDTLKLAPE